MDVAYVRASISMYMGTEPSYTNISLICATACKTAGRLIRTSGGRTDPYVAHGIALYGHTFVYRTYQAAVQYLEPCLLRVRPGYKSLSSCPGGSPMAWSNLGESGPPT